MKHGETINLFYMFMGEVVMRKYIITKTKCIMVIIIIWNVDLCKEVTISLVWYENL